MTLKFEKRGKPMKNDRHLRFIASLPCLICGTTEMIQAHHILKTYRGMAMKAGDNEAIPLCYQDHHRLHMSGGETEWLAEKNLPPAKEIADELYKLTGNSDAALEYINELKGIDYV